MVIDFHTHIFPDKIAPKTIENLETASGITAATKGTLDDLILSMEKNGVDISVILPVVTKPSQFDTINEFAEKVNTVYKGRLISFGGIHPDCENYKEKLDYIKRLGLAGIKIHPDYQGVMIDDKRYMDIIEYADSIGLIIVTHAGIDIGIPDPVHCPPDKMRNVLDAIKPKKMVLAHYGGWKQWEEVYHYLAGQDVYFDTAFTFDFIEPDVFKKILHKHGNEKILFATDSPWSNAAANIKALRGMELDDKTIENILSANARRLLSL